jgi:DNA repair exonuclease SbcCD ATPase subunit
MPGPTTESVNEDVKDLREDLHKVDVSLRESIHRAELSLTSAIGKVETEVRVTSNQVRGIITWTRVLAVFVLMSIGSAIYWGATQAADLRNLSDKMDEKFKETNERFNKIDERFNKLEERFDRLEALIKANAKGDAPR